MSARGDSLKSNDQDNLKKFAEMMRRFDVEVPEDFGKPTVAKKDICEEFSDALTCYDTILTMWVKDCFEYPDDAIKALKRGEKLREASAALFYYCYSSLEESCGKLSGWFTAALREWCQLREGDRITNHSQACADVIKKWYHRAEVIDSQLNHIRDNLFVDDVKYPKKELYAAKPSIEVLVRTALIILKLKSDDKSNEGTTALINDTYQTFREIGIKL